MAGWLFAGLVSVLVGAGYWWTAVYSVRADANLAWGPGVRLPHVVEDREVWLRVHRAARPWFLWPGVAMAVAGPLFVLWGALAPAPGGAEAPVLALCAFMTVTVFIAAGVGLRAGNGSAPAGERASE